MELLTAFQLVYGTALKTDVRVKLLQNMGIDFTKGGGVEKMNAYAERGASAMGYIDSLLERNTKEVQMQERENSALSLVSALSRHSLDKGAALGFYLDASKPFDDVFTRKQALQIFEDNWGREIPAG